MSLLRRHPLSERELAARRANAQRSTGPRTARGKARSRLNALKHGGRSRRLAAFLKQAGIDLCRLDPLARMFRLPGERTDPILSIFVRGCLEEGAMAGENGQPQPRVYQQTGQHL